MIYTVVDVFMSMLYSQSEGPFRPLLNVGNTIKLETSKPIRVDKLLIVANDIDSLDVIGYSSSGDMYDIALNSDRVSLQAIHELVEGLKQKDIVIDQSHLAVKGEVNTETRFLSIEGGPRGTYIDSTVNLEIPADDRGVVTDMMNFQRFTDIEYNISESGSKHVVSPMNREGFVIADEGSKPHWDIADQLRVDREDMVYQAMALGRRWNPDRL